MLNILKMLSGKLTLYNELCKTNIAYINYFLDFYSNQPEIVQKKIEWTLNLIRMTYHVPEKYFKHLEGIKDLYEIRVEVGNNVFKIFSFFDKGNIVVIGNAFQKKTQKTTKNEIERAIKIMEEYYYEKYKE
jgi:phage-related protein